MRHPFTKNSKVQILLLMAFCSSSLPLSATTYAEKYAFCIDYASNRVDSYSSTITYDTTRYFQECMRNADSYIRRHEERKARQERESAILREKIRKQREAREAREKAVQQYREKVVEDIESLF